MRGTVKCRWIKLIDSLGPSDPDEATFTKLPNGDYLETGSMPSPNHNDDVTEFEEVWRRGALLPGSECAWIIQSVDGKTFLGRVGGSYLALSEGKGGVFNARREEWDEQDGWRIIYAIGNVEGLPRLASSGNQIKKEASWSIGEKVVVLGNDYVVRGFEEL
jgi:Protein HRI1